MSTEIHDAQAKIEAAFSDEGRLHFVDLLWPGRHSILFSARRAAAILQRIQMVAWLAAAAMPVCIAADLLLLPWPLAETLGFARIAMLLGFVGIAVFVRRAESLPAARIALAALIAVPTAFFVFAKAALGGIAVTDLATALIATYALFPFVIAAGIAIFPITTIEGAILLAPILVAEVGGRALFGGAADWSHMLGTLWLLGMIAGVALLAAMSQLHLMFQLLGTTARDRLTGTFTRRVGEELLDLYFSQSRREDKPLSIFLLDLDDFKSVNDRHGHDAGDRALEAAGKALLSGVRRGDVVIRWGGDEFLAILPNTPAVGADQVVARVCGEGLGTRLSGGPQTASIGVAERRADRAMAWKVLVKRADTRAARAKQEGKNRCVSCDDKIPEDALAA